MDEGRQGNEIFHEGEAIHTHSVSINQNSPRNPAVPFLDRAVTGSHKINLTLAFENSV